MQLDPDFSEFIACCVAREVKFLIVGGYAVAAHGYPRYTKDLDVWVLADLSNADRLLRALDDFGFGSLGLTANDFTGPGSIVQLGMPPKRIDILTSVSGIEFKETYEQRIPVRIVGVDTPVPFIDLASLRRNKAASGRAQDLADLEILPEA